MSFELKNPEGLVLLNVQAEAIEKDGERCIRVVRSFAGLEDETLVIVPDVFFQNGIIELELAGERHPEADPDMRGFVGLAFRIDPDNFNDYECIYLRPENGRAEEQIRRNHTTQYISHPEYPWYRLRSEAPGVYESYVDLLPGEWTKMKIEVQGNRASLFIGEADQPCLLINDLKKGERAGLVGLWLHTSTLAHFKNLRITKSN